jgi:hypothetical protein
LRPSTEGSKPVQWILSQDALKVFVKSKIIWRRISELFITASFLAKLDGCVLVLDEP